MNWFQRAMRATGRVLKEGIRNGFVVVVTIAVVVAVAALIVITGLAPAVPIPAAAVVGIA
jgi:hypothetical protein